MFVRKKKNKSGSISVQIIQKDNGYKVFKTIGSSSDPDEIECLVLRRKHFIKSSDTQQPYLLPVASREYPGRSAVQRRRRARHPGIPLKNGIRLLQAGEKTESRQQLFDKRRDPDGKNGYGLDLRRPVSGVEPNLST